MNWINPFGSSNCVNFRNFWYRMYGWFTTSYLLEFRQIVYEIREVWKRCPPDNRYITITSLDSRDQLKIILLPSNLHPLFTHTRRTETFDNTVDRIFRNIRVIEHDFISSNDERNRIEERIDWEERISRFERRGSVPSPPPPLLLLLLLPQQGLTRRYLCLAALDPAFDDSRSGVNPPPSPLRLAIIGWLHSPLALLPFPPRRGEKAREEKSKPTPRPQPSLLLSFFLSFSRSRFSYYVYLRLLIDRIKEFPFVSFHSRVCEKGIINLGWRWIDAFPSNLSSLFVVESRETREET